MSIISEYIADSIDEAMVDYTASEEYKQEQAETNKAIELFRNTLSESQKVAFNNLIDRLSLSHGHFASNAYVAGVVQGMSLKNEFIPAPNQKRPDSVLSIHPWWVFFIPSELDRPIVDLVDKTGTCTSVTVSEMTNYVNARNEELRVCF